MPNFAPTEEQEEVRNLARSLALEQLRPQGRSSEKQGDISPELMRTLAQTGLTMPFPEQFGGSGTIEAVTYALIAEELGFGDGALAMSVIGSLMGPITVLLAGNEEQQRTFIPPFCDERSAVTVRGSLAFAERGGGYELADIQATARRDGDSYIVNGTKRDVLHGAGSSPRVALFRLEGTSGLEGLCALMVPDQAGERHVFAEGSGGRAPARGPAPQQPIFAEGNGGRAPARGPTPQQPRPRPYYDTGLQKEDAHPDQAGGLRIQNDDNKLGLIAVPSASFDFENAAIGAGCMLGEPGNSGVIRAAALYDILRASVACGMARAALEYAIDYARGRIAFGRPIASYQGIAFIVAEMAMKLDAARLYVWRAATEWDGDSELETLVRDGEAALRQALRMAKSTTLDAVQVLGGAGFIQDHPVEMWARNAAAME